MARSRARVRGDGSVWQEASSFTQSMMWLTADELGEVNLAVRDLLISKLDRFQHPERRLAGARLCAFMAWGAPAYAFETEPGEQGKNSA